MDRSGNKINLPVQLLRTVVSVADLGTFTKAAHALKVAQPGISTRVKRLQQLVGTELLTTSNGRLHLSEQGEIVVGYARQISR
jgi:DNA-binding transcriptional LysR family regulator